MGRKGSSGLNSSSSGAFKAFSDKAKNGFEYIGDGKDQDQLFRENSNLDELIETMDPGQRRAFKDWGAGWFMDGQQYEGWDNMSDSFKKYTQIYDDTLDKSVLKQGVTVVRRSDPQLILGAGKTTATLAELQAAEGSVVTSKGNMSFAAAAEGLSIGNPSGKKVEYYMKIKGGTKGAGMYIGDKRINDWGNQQREFMTNRDISVKVGKTTYDKHKDVYKVELEYVGRQAHDYGTTGRI